MEFAYEAIGDEKFQKLCQTILVDLFPNVQCLPVGMPDGGRDAFTRHDSGLIIFQVKFSRDPSARTERDAISSLIAGERDKIERLIERGATSYYLLTNIGGTSHLDSGSIDRVNLELTKAFGIPTYVWWRDDIDRRIEASSAILWRYPELARGQDFLEFLAKQKSEQSYSNSTRAFTAYMQTQHTKEADVKFQQVQIQSSLLDLFTDTPIGQARDKLPSKHSLAMSEAAYQSFEASLQRRRQSHFDVDDGDMLAAGWLLTAAPDEGLQRVVLEGAPGQGKSTVTQYLCQLHRTVALKKAPDIAKIPPDHRESTLRLPMRVDLRDYALWLTGKDPLASEKGVPRPENSDDSLESLIAYQVHRLSGGSGFSINNLAEVLDSSHSILVLDGFDEVADIGTRSKIIEQTRFAGDRLALVCRSLQLIVTSRPAAFILSPGFPERDWAHLALLPMRREQIIGYTDRWINARGVAPKDAKDFKELLLDRINRPHIRSLAQNPMQLAILLNLISTKGMSLPDKRTALYDSYMDLFFGREAEKDGTVRENRDILLQIHQYVAWILQLDAERPGGTGSISQSDLQELVGRFLTEKEHKGDVLKLFTGAVERVGALVSRVQGMLEFEVQPLREYFAGKFLYETAPYSPPGAERRGTKPERFAGLAKRPYWSNVIRFYAGCYSSGELLSLVDGLEDLAESSEFSLRIHAMQLSVLFLGDYVFAQEPRTVRKVVELITRGDNFRYLVANRSAWEESRLSLPDNCGRAEMTKVAYSQFDELAQASFLSRIGAVLRMNSPLEDRWAFWKQLPGAKRWKLVAARALGIIEEADQEKISELVLRYSSDVITALIQSNRWDDLNIDQRILGIKNAVTPVSDVHGTRPDMGRRIRQDMALYRVFLLLHPYTYSFLSYNRDAAVPMAAMFSRYGFVFSGQLDEDTSRFDEKGLNDIIHACYRATNITVVSWSTELTAWSDIIESARRTWGDSFRLNALASIAAGIKSKDVRAKGFSDLHDPNLPLAERARHARLRTSVVWWKEQLLAANCDLALDLALTILFSWAPGSVLRELSSDVCIILDRLSSDRWSSLFSSLRAIISVTSESRGPITGAAGTHVPDSASPRLKAALLLRLPRAGYKKLLISFAADPVDDLPVMKFVSTRMISEALRDPKLWPATIALFQASEGRFDLAEDQVDELDLYYGHRDTMPLSAAKIVAESPAQFPVRMIELAENTFSGRPSDGLTSLGELASHEGWF
jgi:hypothetical protein